MPLSPDRIANAPCSWGVVGREGVSVSGLRMLDELVESGYRGTELGDPGFLPSDPDALRAALQGRGLTLLGGYVPLDLAATRFDADARDAVLRVARLLAAAERGPRRPIVVIADRDGLDPQRLARAGRLTPAEATPERTLARFGARLEAIADATFEATGLRVALHPHVASRIELPEETAAVLAASDPAKVGLVFDTAHYVYGTGRDDPDGRRVFEGLERFWDRIATIHVKDCSQSVAARARREGMSYEAAVAGGLYAELGEGSIDLPAVVAWLHARGYDDWLTVEQDVLPGLGTPLASATRNHRRLRAWIEDAAASVDVPPPSSR
ncbi:MAG: sugar phosphate isomerase/epimerase [Trueperaceae bacterium]|nr:sugar phosphate isomerase/epimerase [Trueperaceae bacterium]